MGYVIVYPNTAPQRETHGKALEEMEARITELGETEFEFSALQQEKIRVLPMSLSGEEEHDSNQGFFFDQYFEAFSLMDPPDEEEVGKDGDGGHGDDNNDDWREKLSEKAKERLEQIRPLFSLGSYFHAYGSECRRDIVENDKPSPGEWISSNRYGKIARKCLVEHRPDYWHYLSISEAPPSPHFQCKILYNAVGDDQHLFRGELLAMIRLMRARLKLKSTRMTMMGHITVPVSSFPSSLFTAGC